MPYEYKRQPLSRAEAIQLARACKTPTEKLIIWTLLDTGLRCSELARLTPQRIDWTQRLLMVRKPGVGARGTQRVVPMTPRVRAVLTEHFATHKTLGLLSRTIERVIVRTAARTRIRRAVTPHVLRHTFAVTALRKGISLPTLQRLLGHVHLVSTGSYCILYPQNIESSETIKEFRAKW